MNDRYNQERSIREIMTNPSFASCKLSFGDEDDPIDDKNLDFEYVAEVEKLLETSNHNKVLAIYKKEYKNAVGSEQKAHILLKIAFVFEKSDQLDYALKTYEKCLKLGSNTKAFVRLGDLQILKGDIEEGIDNL
jgi:tetratricopeptide (TPR) repeat protein